jgi:flagellar protein FliL
MAEATAAAAANEAPAAKKSKRRLLMLIVLVLALAGGGAGAWWWFTSHAKPKVAAAPPPEPPRYLALDPPFVVNFESEQVVRFLQITVQIMSRDTPTIDLLKNNDPVVRDRLLQLFANQTYAVLATKEGKADLRAQALQTVRGVLGETGGHPEKLEAVYFTSFVMQ